MKNRRRKGRTTKLNPPCKHCGHKDGWISPPTKGMPKHEALSCAKCRRFVDWVKIGGAK